MKTKRLLWFFAEACISLERHPCRPQILFSFYSIIYTGDIPLFSITPVPQSVKMRNIVSRAAFRRKLERGSVKQKSGNPMFLRISALFVILRLRGLEPRTPWLRVRCSTNWARSAFKFCVFPWRKCYYMRVQSKMQALFLYFFNFMKSFIKVL